MNQNFLDKIQEDIEYAKTTEHLVSDQRETLENLMRENLRYSRAIFEDSQKIRKYLFWQRIISIVWLVVVLAPIVLALFWLPPLLQNLFGSYSELLGGGKNALDLMGQLQSQMK